MDYATSYLYPTDNQKNFVQPKFNILFFLINDMF